MTWSSPDVWPGRPDFSGQRDTGSSSHKFVWMSGSGRCHHITWKQNQLEMFLKSKLSKFVGETLLVTSHVEYLWYEASACMWQQKERKWLQSSEDWNECENETRCSESVITWHNFSTESLKSRNIQTIYSKKTIHDMFLSTGKLGFMSKLFASEN